MFDNRGIGRTSKPAGPYSSRLLADDAKALVDHLGITGFHLLGVSMGGMIVQEYALAYPEDLRSVIMACTYAAPGPFCSRMFAMWADAAPVLGIPFVMRDVTLWAFTTEFFSDRPDELAEFETAMRYMDQPVPASGDADSFAGTGTATAPPPAGATLPRGEIGLLGVLMPGLAQVAPAFNLFFTTGLMAAFAGASVPLVFLISMVGLIATAASLALFSGVFPSAGSFLTYIARSMGVRTSVVVGVITLLGSIIAFGPGHIGALASDPNPFHTAASRFISPLAPLITWIFLTSVTSSYVAANTQTARVIFARARGGLWARSLASVSPRFRTPWAPAIAFVAPSTAIGVISTAFTDPGTAVGLLSTYGILGLVLMYLMANIALIVQWARSRRSGVRKNVWAWVVTPVIGVLVLAIPIWGDLRPGQPAPYSYLPWLTIALIAAGVVYMLVLSRVRPQAVEHAVANLEGEIEAASAAL
jgi:amino acid transporter